MAHALLKGETGEWEMVIGLEVHAQVLTKSKLFSGASADFGAAVLVICNAVDDPPYCDFYFPSVVRRGVPWQTAGVPSRTGHRVRAVGGLMACRSRRPRRAAASEAGSCRA